MRLSLNDVQTTEVLFGIIKDLDERPVSYNLEASRRLGESWRLSLEARFFTNLAPEDPQYPLRQDDYVQLELARYF